MILAFIVAIVFGAFYRGMGWVGVLVFVVGASMGALGMYLLKDIAIYSQLSRYLQKWGFGTRSVDSTMRGSHLAQHSAQQ